MTIPTLNIEEVVDPLVAEMRVLASKAEKVSIFAPIRTFSKLRNIRKEHLKILNKYETALEDCYAKTAAPTQGPGVAMSFIQTWSLSKGLTATLRLQTTWSDLSALIDRKFTYTTAVLSMYIAVLSLFLTVAFGILSLPSSSTVPKKEIKPKNPETTGTKWEQNGVRIANLWEGNWDVV